MSMLFGGAKKPQAQTVSAVTDLSVQTSTQGAVVPVVYGTQRITGNMIWYGDFQAIPQYSNSGGGGGGKGGGGGNSSTVSDYNYQCAFAFAVSSGTVIDVGRIWWEKTLYDLSSLPGSAQLLKGELDQSAWSYLSSCHPGQDLNYTGLAYVGMSGVSLGNSYNMPNIAYELLGKGPAAGFQAISGVSHSINLSALKASPSDSKVAAIAAQLGSPASFTGNQAFDTSPAYCVYDLLTNDVYGASFPAARVADLSGYALWCEAQGISFSVVLDSAQDARSVLQDWLKKTQAEAVWSGGVLRIVPYADATVSGTRMDGSTATYSPDLTPVMSIDDSLMLQTQQDEPPLTVTRKDPADAKNLITLEYTDRSNAYAKTVVTSEDPAHIARYGLRADSSVTAHEFTSGSVAQKVCDLLLARSTNIVTTYEWRMGGIAALLEPMDIIALSDDNQGLAATSVRVLEIEEEEDTVFRVKAEAVPGAIAVTVERPLQPSLGYAADHGADPGDVNVPILFEPPAAVTGGDLELWVAASGGTNWGGANIWVSQDGSSYSRIGAITVPSRQGLLTADLAEGSALDVVNCLAVDMSLSRSQLGSGTALDAANYNTLCYLDGEYLAYQTATLTGSYQYGLTTLYRGLYGSEAGDHAAGAPFARLDDGIFKYAFASNQIGRPLWVKFTSYNLFGSSEQDLSQVQAYSLTVTGNAQAAVLPEVTGLTTAYVSGIAQLSWDAVSDSRNPDFEIRKGPTWGSGIFVCRTSVPQTPSVGDGTYWVATHYTVSDGYELYSKTPASVTISGSQLVNNVVASHDEAAAGWSGTLSSMIPVGGYLQMDAGDDIRLLDDLKGSDNILYDEGAVALGCYTIPDSRRIDVGRVATCPVVMTVHAIAQPCQQDIRSFADVLSQADLCAANLGPLVSATPQLRISADGVTWGNWQNWLPGSYSGRVFDFRLLLSTSDASVMPVVEGFSYLVDVPDRLDSFSGLSIPAAGYQLNFSDGLSGNPAAPFNGGSYGQAVPNVLVTVIGGSSADTPVVTNLTNSGFFIQVRNGGNAVARTVNIIAQGY